MRLESFLITTALLLSGCSGSSELPESQQTFFKAVAELCGQAFSGQLASTDEQDADFANERLIMHVSECSNDQILIPFNVGDNRSRTWVISRTDNGLRLKHDHRHEDGTSDAVTMYGGDTVSDGTTTRQEFPVDQFSKDLFVKEGLDISVTNVWAMEIRPDDMFAYELRRPNRFFRVVFDLTRPVDTPPPSWGVE